MKKALYVAPIVAVVCNGAIAWTPGQQCSADYDMSTYYQCDCPIEDRMDTGWIVGPCDSYEQIWCYDADGVCAGDGGEGACGACGCTDSVGDWEKVDDPFVGEFMQRVITTYSHSDNYYICRASTERQTACLPGYYNNSTSRLDCRLCPSFNGTAGASDIGATSITDCYIAAGTTFSDSTGTYTYTRDCYYSN